MERKGLTVACLISPVAVWPAQKTRPGILTAGPFDRGQRGMNTDDGVKNTYSCEVWEGIRQS